MVDGSRPDRPTDTLPHSMAQTLTRTRSRSTPSKPPRDEAGLVDLFIESLPRTLPCRADNDWKICREMAVGRSIADVVAFPWVEFTDSLRPLSTPECVVLAYLRNFGPTRTDILERRLGWSKKCIRQDLLEALAAQSLISFGSGGRVSLRRFRPWPSELWAFEAKLARWQEALDQARAYQRYADRAFVVLPLATSSAACRNLSSFRSAGVGLILVDRGRATVVLRARRSSEHDWRREFALSRLSQTGDTTRTSGK